MVQETSLATALLGPHSYSPKASPPLDVLDLTPQPNAPDYVTFSRAIANRVRLLHCPSFLYEQRIVLIQHSGVGQTVLGDQADALAKQVHRWAVLLDSPLVRDLPPPGPAKGQKQALRQSAGAPQHSLGLCVAGYADGRPSVDRAVLRQACAAAVAGGCEYLWLDALCVMHEHSGDVQWHTQHVLPAMVRHRACVLSLVLPEGLRLIVELERETRWLADVRHLLQVFAPPRGAAVKVVHALPFALRRARQRGSDSPEIDSEMMFWTLAAGADAAAEGDSEPTEDMVRWPLVCLESGAAAMTDVQAILHGSLTGIHLWRRELAAGGSLVKLTNRPVYPCTFGRVRVLRSRRRPSWAMLGSRVFFFESVLTAMAERDSPQDLRSCEDSVRDHTRRALPESDSLAPCLRREAAVWRCVMSTPLVCNSFLAHVHVLTWLLYDLRTPKEAARVAIQVRERLCEIESRGSEDAMFLDVLAFLLSLLAAEPASRLRHTFSHNLKGKLLLPDHCIPPPDSGALRESEGRMRVEYRAADCGYSAYVSPTSCQLEIIGRAIPVQPRSWPRRRGSRGGQESVVLVGDDGAAWGRVGRDCKTLERIHYCAVAVGHYVYHFHQANWKTVYTRVIVLRRVKDCKGENKLKTWSQVRGRWQWVVHAWASAPKDLFRKRLWIDATAVSRDKLGSATNPFVLTFA